MQAPRGLSVILAALVCAAAGLGPVLAASKMDSQLGENEVKMGADAAAQIANDYKLSTDAAALKRVREIGDKIAAIANKTEVKAIYGSSKITPFKYEFNIVEDEDINAFSVPGGHIYVNTGLLKFVETDQELAGVIAHEIVHAAHHHMVYLLQKQAAMQVPLAVALLAAMIGGAGSTDVGNIALGVQLYQIARLNGYGMQAERDADYGAITYLRDSGYNPVGLLTFLERLARRPEFVDYGIYRSHPLDAERVAAAKKAITELGLPINRRETTNAIKAEVKTETISGAEVPEVVIKDTVIYRPAPADGKTSAERAQEAADAINQALDAGIQMHEIRTDPRGGGVIARDKVIIDVTDADAKLMGKTPEQVTQIAAAAIREVVWKQMVETMH